MYICMMPDLPITFPSLILHWLDQKGFPSSSSLFGFLEANWFMLFRKDHFTRSASHSLRIWRPAPLWGSDRTWGRMEVPGISMVHGSEFDIACSTTAQRAGRTSAEQSVLLHINLLSHISLSFLHVFLLFSFDVREPWQPSPGRSLAGEESYCLCFQGPMISPLWYQWWGEESGKSSRRQ